jgi:hypothetical protein
MQKLVVRDDRVLVIAVLLSPGLLNNSMIEPILAIPRLRYGLIQNKDNAYGHKLEKRNN